MQIHGKRVLLTGAASGIGLATARALSGLGLTVVMVDVEAEKLADAAASMPGETMTEAMDVSDTDAIAALADKVFDRWGRTDFLMNNAAIRVAGGTGEEIDDWRRTMDVNFWPAVYAEHAFLPRMIEAGRPAMIDE